MMIILTTVVILFLLLTIYYLLHTIKKIHATDLESLNIDNIAKEHSDILVIYPHPDDETMGSGGLIMALSNYRDVNLHVISLTHGEKGKEFFNLPDDQLAKVRAEEFHSSLNVLGIKSNAELWNFPDGKIEENYLEVKNKIEEFIHEKDITLVVTYERTGMYGHPDHIALSKIVYELSKKLKFNSLYSSIPKKLRDRMKLPDKLHFEDKIVELDNLIPDYPTYKLSLGMHAWKRYFAAKKYKSQNLGTKKTLRFLIFSMYEYYTDEYSDNETVNN